MKKGTKKFLEKLSEDYELILFTTRNMKISVKWLIDNDIDKYFKDATNIKLPAYIYLDDRAIQFNGSYENILKAIKEFKVYWKQKQKRPDHQSGLLIKKGDTQIRTGGKSFAGSCLTTWPCRHLCKLIIL